MWIEWRHYGPRSIVAAPTSSARTGEHPLDLARYLARYARVTIWSKTVAARIIFLYRLAAQSRRLLIQPHAQRQARGSNRYQAP